MATPVIENIVVNIAAAIDLITTANSFEYTLTARRPKRVLFGDETWKDLDVLVVQGAEKSRIDLIGGLGVKEIVQGFFLMAITIDSDKASTSIDTKNNKVAADIEKKIMEDINRGTYAVNTEVVDKLPLVENEFFSGITVEIDVTYRVNIDNPYTKA